MSNTHIQKIKSSITFPLVVATVNKCLAPCGKCSGYYMDSLTGRFHVNCKCGCHQTKEGQ